MKQYVKDIYKTDDYTVVFELTQPYTRFHNLFTSLIYSTTYIQPKHIWEKVENPLTFTFNPPVSIAPYVLDSYDSQGYWFLFKKRGRLAKNKCGSKYMESQNQIMFFSFTMVQMIKSNGTDKA